MADWATLPEGIAHPASMRRLQKSRLVLRARPSIATRDTRWLCEVLLSH
jgi:hypothetical protein